MPTVNFFQPGTDAAVEQQQIDRQRQMAQALLLQAQKPSGGQMVSGHYVAPGIASALTQALQGAGSHLVNERADQKQTAMGEALRARNSKEANDFMTAINGSPAKNVPLNVQNDDEGNPLPLAQSAAVAPDRGRALALALQSQNPTLQSMGGKLMDQQMNEQEMAAALKSVGFAPPGAAPAAPVAPGGAPATPSAPGGLLGGSPTGLPAGINPQAAALTLSRLPQLNKLGAMIQDSSKPQTLAPGGTAWSQTGGALYTAPMAEPGIQVTNQPGGGQSAAPVANYAAVKADQEGAIARAKQGAESENTMVSVKMPDGSERQMTRAQFIQMTNPQGGPAANAGPRPMGQPPVTQGAPVRGAFEGSSDQILSDIGTIKDPAARRQAMEAYSKQVTGNNPAFVPPAGVSAPAGGMPAGGIQGQSPADKEYATTRAGAFAKRADAIQTAGSAASGAIKNLDTLETLFKDPNVAQGGAAESISGLKNYAASAGVDIKGVGAEQAVQAITNKMALDSRSTAEGGGMPGAMSDADRNFLSNQQPGLNKTPEGRALIIGNARKLAQRQLDAARMAQQYEQQNGKLDAGFDRELQEYADKNQMFANQKAPAAAATPDFRALAAQELARRKGGK